LQNETNLTRASLAKILIESKSLDKFKENPQRYMEEVTKIIRSEMMHRVIDGIKYTKIGDDEFYAQELFETEELTGYLEKNMIESNKSVYQYVVYDSAVEESFASQFESNEIVKLYTKLPSWFKISTPLGSYNPDWAVLIEVRGERKLYFVIESKGSIDHYDLRPTESAKITCGRKHFEALNSGADFKVADNANSIFDNPI
jgi:type III restriction enzyme